MAIDSNAYLKATYERSDTVINWLNFLLLGLITGAIAFGISKLSDFLVKLAWMFPQDMMNRDLHEGLEVSGLNFFFAWLVFVIYCTGVVAISAAMCLWWSPPAIGSGVVESMVYINGAIMQGFVSWPTLIVKCFGICLAVAGGLKIGKEGPIVHIGAMVGVMMLYIPWTYSEKFRNDRDKKIMVAAGAGTGMAVAFGAPIGGLLFAYEIS